MRKYCDDCIHFIKKGFKCKLFGYSLLQHKKNINYHHVLYSRQNNFLCGNYGTFYINKEEYLLNFNKFNKRLK
jgi:hypothetical protein